MSTVSALTRARSASAPPLDRLTERARAQSDPNYFVLLKLTLELITGTHQLILKLTEKASIHYSPAIRELDLKVISCVSDSLELLCTTGTLKALMTGPASIQFLLSEALNPIVGSIHLLGHAWSSSMPLVQDPNSPQIGSSIATTEALSPESEPQGLFDILELAGKVSEEESIWLFQANQCGWDRAINPVAAEQTRVNLMSFSVPGIIISDKPFPPRLLDGADTAITLAFANRYFQIKTRCADHVLPEFELIERLKESAGQFSCCSQEMIDKQAAYEMVLTDEIKNDGLENKLQTIANDYDLILHEYWQIESGQTPQGDLNPPAGVYLIRLWKPSDDGRQEVRNYNMILIYELGLNLLMDPNHGLRKSTLAKINEELLSCFNEYLERNDLSLARFYRVQSNKESSSL